MLKILMQNNRRWLGLPIKDYYRGWRFPLFSASLFNMIVFPMHDRTKKFTKSDVENFYKIYYQIDNRDSSLSNR